MILMQPKEDDDLAQPSAAVQATFNALISGQLALDEFSTNKLVDSVCLVADFHKLDPGNAEAIRLDRDLRRELEHRTRSRTSTWLGGFALATPAGIVAGTQIQGLGEGHSLWPPILEGLAAGSFLYVAAYNLLPEVFHGHDQRGARVIGLLGGLAVFAVTTTMMHPH